MIADDSSLLHDLRTVLIYLSASDDLAPADVIIGFGSDYPEVACHVAGLYEQGLAPHVLFTGGRGRLTGNVQSTEATFLKAIAIDEGIPVEAIATEENSRNAIENMQFGLQLLVANGMSATRVISTTQLALQRRIWATIQQQNAMVKVIKSPPPWTNAVDQVGTKSTIALCRLALGEIERLPSEGEWHGE